MPTLDDDIRRSMRAAAERIHPARAAEARLEIVERRGARARTIRYARNVAWVAIALVAIVVVGSRARDARWWNSVPADSTPPPADLAGTYRVRLPIGSSDVQSTGTAGTWTITLSDGSATFIPPSAFASSPVYASYSVAENTFTTSAFEGSVCTGSGSYTWERTSAGLRFEVIDDPCPVRIAILTAGLTRQALTPVDGTWQTDPITTADQARAITSAGFPRRFVDAFLRDQGERRTIRYSITFEDGVFTTHAAADGGANQGLDNGSYEVRDDRLILRPFSGGSTTYRFAVDGDSLSLELLVDTQAPYRGIPDEVFVRGIYLVAPFTKSTT
jgi:hypothetical protein